MELGPDAATIAEILRDQAGYATMMVGKWHLAKDSDCSAAGPQHSWPCQRGFDRFYGILDAFTNLHQPHRLVEDNHLVEVDRYPDDYYFTDDLTDHAISMIRERKASNPEQPFLLLLRARRGPRSAARAGARHREVPRALRRWLGPAAGGALRCASKSSASCPKGWSCRRATPRRTTTSDPGTTSTRASGSCSPRHMEVYAAMVDRIDQNVGRLVGELDALGELDNTIIVFLSDNGASREGEVTGTTAYYVHLLQGDDLDADYARLDQIGGPQTTPHYPRGWAMASGTPFRLYKINTHQGGHSVPFCLSWPAGLPVRGSIRTQYAHVTDLLPTLLELIGVERPEAAPGHRARATRGRELRCRAHRPRRAQHPPPAGLRVQRAPRAVPGRLGARDPAPTAHAVHRLGVGAVRPDRGSNRAAQPRGRGTGTGPGDGRGVGGARVGALRVPARRGQQHQVPATTGAQRGVRRAGDHPARHTDAWSGGARSSCSGSGP